MFICTTKVFLLVYLQKFVTPDLVNQNFKTKTLEMPQIWLHLMQTFLKSNTSNIIEFKWYKVLRASK